MLTRHFNVNVAEAPSTFVAEQSTSWINGVAKKDVTD